MSETRELDGRRALVTGGTKGIGEAVAARLREAGATVLTTARARPRHRRRPLRGGRPRHRRGLRAVADAVRDRLGGVDIIVHVVGGSSAPAGGFAAARRRRVAARARPEPVPRRAAGSRAAAGDARARLGRDHPRHLDPGAAAAARGHPRLRRREGRALELQQGPVQGSEPEGHPRGAGLARLGRDRRRRRPGEELAKKTGTDYDGAPQA